MPRSLEELRSDQFDAQDRGYPRPQLRRQTWVSLNGEWDFAIDRAGQWTHPRQVQWGHHILVPFSPEAPASGIGDTSYYSACWYRTTINLPTRPNHRWLLHLGAVDYRAVIWLNGVMACSHEGGYTPFSVDLGPFVASGPLEVIVHAQDDPLDLAKPRGKQDWQEDPHSIWYPRTTGIWQTVWLESVPSKWIGRLAFTPDLRRWEVGVEVWLHGKPEGPERLDLRLRANGDVLAEDSYRVVGGEVHRRLALSDPGIDDSRNDLLWSPDRPTLIDATFELHDGDDGVIDRVDSYTALRTAAVQGDRFVLNGRPYVLRMVLDQGYWPDGGLTAPDDDALARDVRLAKQMGFNGVRKHQKIEDPRYLFWADTLGLLVWEEMPSAYRFTRESIRRLCREWMEVLERDYSHPCIVTWVPINESWGVPNLPDNPRERHYIQALYHLTKTLDETRPVIGNDGWESVVTDIVGIHDYDDRPDRLGRRYHGEVMLPRLFKRERPGGRLLVLDGQEKLTEAPLMLTEFGGIALKAASGSWGYSTASGARDFASRYEALLGVVRNLELLAGFCYTQFADTYQEANGLLRGDRTPKFPIERIHAATAGPARSEIDEGTLQLDMAAHRDQD
jgi:beta-galactosidase/beta-glucuronidase